MGWIGTKQTRAQAVREIVQRNENAVCVAYTEVPCGVWSVWELTGKGEHNVGRAGQRIIALDLIEERNGYQMVKTMDETVGPCYYDCPLTYLEAAQDFAGDGYSAAWREKVREHWNAPTRVTRSQQFGWTFAPADGVSHDD